MLKRNGAISDDEEAEDAASDAASAADTAAASAPSESGAAPTADTVAATVAEPGASGGEAAATGTDPAEQRSPGGGDSAAGDRRWSWLEGGPGGDDGDGSHDDQASRLSIRTPMDCSPASPLVQACEVPVIPVSILTCTNQAPTCAQAASHHSGTPVLAPWLAASSCGRPGLTSTESHPCSTGGPYVTRCPRVFTRPRTLTDSPHPPARPVQITMCATASLVTPHGVVPGRLDLSVSQAHFVGDPPKEEAASAAKVKRRLSAKSLGSQIEAVLASSPWQ